MKIEKLNENKIRIILNTDDLKEKNIDFHSFVSNSIESQELFLNMLDEAERKVGFKTKDYKLMIEALAMTGGDFVLTITRLNPERDIEKTRYKKFNIKRKNIKSFKDTVIYSFDSFDDFLGLCNFIENNSNLKETKIFKNSCLYLYNSKYYLKLTKYNEDISGIKMFYSSIVEFAQYVNNSDVFQNKLSECGKIIISSNAINVGIKYFVK